MAINFSMVAVITPSFAFSLTVCFAEKILFPSLSCLGITELGRIIVVLDDFEQL